MSLVKTAQTLFGKAKDVFNKLANVEKIALGCAAGASLVNYVVGWGTVAVLGMAVAAGSILYRTVKAKLAAKKAGAK